MTTETWIAPVERRGIGRACLAGIAAWLAMPAARVVITRPMLLGAGGVTLLAVGLTRDPTWCSGPSRRQRAASTSSSVPSASLKRLVKFAAATVSVSCTSASAPRSWCSASTSAGSTWTSVVIASA